MSSYSSFKSADIRWIDKIPEHWQVKPLFAVLWELKERNRGNQEDNVLSLSYGKIIRRDLSQNFGLIPESFETYQLVSPGDIVLRLTDLQNDKKSLRVGLVEEKGIITSAYTSLASSSEIIPKYAYYLLHVYDLMKVFYNEGAGVRQSMNFRDLRRMPVILPSLPEQQAIADYLDHKTAQIDTLIAKKQKQIDLLQEQRTAIITQAVTKGLDHSAPIKDSGFDWLGKIPDYWNLKRIKYIAPRRIEQVKIDDEHGLLLSLDSIESKTGRLIGNGTFEGQGNKFAKGDVLFCKLRPYLCKVIIAPQEGIAVSDLLVLVPSEQVDSKYLFYRFIESNFISVVDSSTYGAKMPRASWDFISNLKCPLPPVAEQQAIADFLDKQISQIDIMVERIFQQIDILQEYRTALISEVVTGKIDVRGEA